MALDTTARALARAMTRVAPLALVAALLVVAAPAAAAPIGTARNTTQLGILGDPGRFRQLTGQRSAVLHAFIGWDQPRTIPKLLGQLSPLPMLALKTGPSVTPLDIAQGRGDGFLLALNSAMAGFGQRVYVRPLPEMNGHWNEYCAFTRGGGSQGPAVLDGGVPARLRAHRLPRARWPGGRAQPEAAPLGGCRRSEATSRARRRASSGTRRATGAPDIPANAAPAYYPGDRVRRRRRERSLRPGVQGGVGRERQALRRAPEQAVRDRRMGAVGHRRPCLTSSGWRRSSEPTAASSSSPYFNSKPGSLWDLASKPRSRAAYRRVITPLGG